MVERSNLVRDRVRHFATEKNISINRIAILGDIKPSSLQTFMNGTTNNPTVKIIEGICDGLGISVYEFFNFEPYNLTPDQKYDMNEKTPEQVLNEYNLSTEQLEDILKIIKKKEG